MANQFLPFGVAGGANVISQAAYAALAARLTGFVAGVAVSEQLNKTWRQSAAVAAMIGQFISDHSGADALDDGNIDVLLDRFEAAYRAQSANYSATVGGSANAITLTFPIPVLSYAVILGAPIRFVAAASNTAGVTVAVDGLTARTVVKPDGTALQAGDITTGSLIELISVGSVFQIRNQTKSASFGYGLQVFGVSGSFIVPDGVTLVEVEVWGGGGAGGSLNSPASESGGGGGGSGYAFKRIVVTPGASMPVVVGTGGVGAGSDNLQSGSGGTSSFGGISATGGQGGYGPNAVGFEAFGGAGGAGSGGDINSAGGSGEGGSAGGSVRAGSGGQAAGGGGPGGAGGDALNPGGSVPGGGGAGRGGNGSGLGSSGANGLVIIRW